MLGAFSGSIFREIIIYFYSRLFCLWYDPDSPQKLPTLGATASATGSEAKGALECTIKLFWQTREANATGVVFWAGTREEPCWATELEKNLQKERITQQPIHNKMINTTLSKFLRGMG